MFSETIIKSKTDFYSANQRHFVATTKVVLHRLHKTVQSLVYVEIILNVTYELSPDNNNNSRFLTAFFQEKPVPEG